MRIAFFSPLTPKPSGIADYSEALLPHLATRVERLDVFIEDYETSSRSSREGFRIRHYREFEPDYRAGCYDVALYQMGNNPFHVYIYELALRIPGVLVLHEFNLHHLLAAVTIVRQDWEGYLREVEYNAGAAALERARQVPSGLQEPDYDNIAMNRRLLRTKPGRDCPQRLYGAPRARRGFLSSTPEDSSRRRDPCCGHGLGAKPACGTRPASPGRFHFRYSASLVS